MSWIRHNVSKSKLQQNAFFKVASQQNQLETKNDIINSREVVDIFAKKNYTSEEYDSASCMRHIDAILYINYKKENSGIIKNEIMKIDPKLSRTLKIDAVENKIPALGTTQSHILALQEFVKNTAWNTCLILEDDFYFNDENTSLIHSTINYFMSTVKNYDMLCLCANEDNSQTQDTDYAFINKIQTTTNKSAYIVTRKYLFKLIGNLMKSSILIKKEGFKEEYAFENFWEKLSVSDNWYSFSEPLGSN
jgi:GR25 family glycosyltransferase involved in LPS biosynthesis